MKSKIIKRIFMCLLFFGLIALVRNAIRDSQLNVDLLRESLLNMPGIVMQNIRFTRTISGDLWQVRLPYLEQRDKTVNFRSADIKRSLSGDKGQWSFFGQSGIYSDDTKTASISNFTGHIKDTQRNWLLESPKLTWLNENNTFIFPEGLTIHDNEFYLRTPLASTDNSHVILLQHGGVIKWSKPLPKH